MNLKRILLVLIVLAVSALGWWMTLSQRSVEKTNIKVDHPQGLDSKIVSSSVAVSERPADSRMTLPEIRKKILLLSEQEKDIENQLERMGFPEVMTEPRFTEAERSRIAELTARLTDVSNELSDLKYQEIDLRLGAK